MCKIGSFLGKQEGATTAIRASDQIEQRPGLPTFGCFWGAAEPCHRNHRYVTLSVTAGLTAGLTAGFAGFRHGFSACADVTALSPSPGILQIAETCIFWPQPAKLVTLVTGVSPLVTGHLRSLPSLSPLVTGMSPFLRLPVLQGFGTDSRRRRFSAEISDFALPPRSEFRLRSKLPILPEKPITGPSPGHRRAIAGPIMRA